jgi:hypothetical protein
MADGRLKEQPKSRLFPARLQSEFYNPDFPPDMLAASQQTALSLNASPQLAITTFQFQSVDQRKESRDET